jgi:hypothetical protein
VSVGMRGGSIPTQLFLFWIENFFLIIFITFKKKIYFFIFLWDYLLVSNPILEYLFISVILKE